MSIRSLFNGDTQYFVINKNTRVITPPTDFKNFGVESDENSNRVYFQCPRYVGDNLDLTTLSVRVNYQNANNDKDQYIVTDVTPDGENVYFSWVLSRKATAYKGSVYFIVCAVKTDSNGVITNEWNTTLTSGTVLSGLEVESPVITEDVTDVVNQLLAIVNGAVTDMESAASEGVANIKAAETQAIAAVSSAPNSLFANAIKGNASGSIIRVDDVSPVEHTVSVKVQSENLLPYPYKDEAKSVDGVTFTPQIDGGIALSGTPTSTFAATGLYQGKPLATKGKVTISLQGEFTGIYFRFDIKDKDNNVLFTSGTYSGSRTIDLDSYPTATQWDIFIRNTTPVEEFTGVLYPQIELGDVVTKYTSYIDPATVTIRTCGRNLLTVPYRHAEGREHNGVTFTVNEDGSVNAKGTATGAAWFTLSETPFEQILPNFWSAVARQDCSYNSTNGITSIFIEAGEEVDRVYYPQIEIGTAISFFEKGTALTEYTPDSEGNIFVNAVSPVMAIYCDTAGVNIECEYNKDTNVVIQSLIDRLVELESN